MRKKEETKERIRDVSRVTILGRKSLYVENFCAVVLYTDTEIQLSTMQNLFKISGENLEIKSLAQGLLEISGEIFNISIEK